MRCNSATETAFSSSSRVCLQIWHCFGWCVMIEVTLDSRIVLSRYGDLNGVTCKVSVQKESSQCTPWAKSALSYLRATFPSCSLTAQTCSWQDVANIKGLHYYCFPRCYHQVFPPNKRAIYTTWVIPWLLSMKIALKEIVKGSLVLTASPMFTTGTICSFSRWWRKYSDVLSKSQYTYKAFIQQKKKYQE